MSFDGWPDTRATGPPTTGHPHPPGRTGELRDEVNYRRDSTIDRIK